MIYKLTHYNRKYSLNPQGYYDGWNGNVKYFYNRKSVLNYINNEVKSIQNKEKNLQYKLNPTLNIVWKIDWRSNNYLWVKCMINGVEYNNDMSHVFDITKIKIEDNKNSV